MSALRFLSLPRLARNSFVGLLDSHVQKMTSGEIVASPMRGGPLYYCTQLRALPKACAEIWGARREIAIYLATGDQPTAARLRKKFGLAPPDEVATPIHNTLFQGRASLEIPPPHTIVIPVFNAHDDIVHLLNRLPSTVSKETSIILVNDGSDDARIAQRLTSFQRTVPNAQIVTHAENLGFVAAVNSGLSAASSKDHILILNTDTLPPNGWIERMLAPIVLDASVATVTPVSNNAEILSIPNPGFETDPSVDMVTAIDRIARQLGDRRIILPTGIGFCMAMNRAFIDRIGGFDPVFGRGYGEEVDWCRRALKAGGRHIVQAGLFVGHKGGASFGSAEKQKRIRAASQVISRRYPAYDGEVRNWVHKNPIGPERLALSLAWLGFKSREQVPIFLGHSLGGGAEAALQAEIKSVLKSAPGAVVLRVGGPRLIRVELHGQSFKLAGDVDNLDLMYRLLEPLQDRRVIYSCGVGAVDPAMVPQILLKMASSKLELRLHDFFPISPSWNLLSGKGRYEGVPRLDTTDPVHSIAPGRHRQGTSYRNWRRIWARVIEEADRIVTFAPSGLELLTEAYPHARPKTVVAPHCIPNVPDVLQPGGATIGVLGGINRAKGGAVLESLAKVTRRRMVVIGEMDRQFRLPKPHCVHGRYDQAKIASLAQHYDVGLWLIPSICPETFSFATHEALASGLPVLGFNLGAQSDALRTAENGKVLHIDPCDAAALSEAIEAAWPRS